MEQMRGVGNNRRTIIIISKCHATLSGCYVVLVRFGISAAR